MDESYDAVIVGSGAAGGWAAKDLTENGLKVLLLEAGPEFDPQTQVPPPGGSAGWYRAVELQQQEAPWRNRKTVQTQSAACIDVTEHLFVDDVDNPYTVAPTSEPFRWIRGRQVGGRTIFWGRVMLRMSDRELHDPDRDGDGESWPLSHADLSPHYDRVERFLGVVGNRDGLPHLPDGAFKPAMEPTEMEQQFVGKMKTAFPDRPVIMQRGIPFARTEAGWPGDSSVGSTIAFARATGNLTLRTDAVASHIIVDPATGKANGVGYIDRLTGAQRQALGRTVVVCASTIESVRLLLNSRSSCHPEGLGNSSGTLGCYLMDHLLASIHGVVPTGRPLSNDHEVGGPCALYIPRFRNLDHPGAGFIRGYGIQTWIQRRGTPVVDPESKVTPFGMLAYCETLARRDNRIQLDVDNKDRWGIPCAHISFTADDNARRMANDAEVAMKEMLALLDAQATPSRRHLPGLSVHEVGGARMGSSSSNSVLNSFAQCWDANNVFVPDGAAFPTSAYQNPTLTIMAVTGRACERLRAELMARNI